MSRTIFTTAGVLGASSLLVLDSAVKGTAILLLAAVAVAILRRDSAATRHLAWLLAIVAMLIVPVLSMTLPQWRVLPEWAGISPDTAAVATSSPSIARPVAGAVESDRIAEPAKIERSSAAAYQPAAEFRGSPPAPATPKIISESAVGSWNWINALPLVWAIGFFALILRLLAARWILWRTERRAATICSSRRPAKATHDTIATALEAACLQLGIDRPVTLLIHPDKTIPVVWGVLRCRVLLPATARDWTGEQLRSVLLHELAHIKRRDTVAQLLTQIACALHWFNPLVWFAAWRLGVERERACDDLVLASGVQPSAYAGHLLDVVTACSPSCRTLSCGLAMARKSSLEGRIAAVLSKSPNRGGVSMVMAAIGLAIAVGVAVPIAMLRASEKQPGQQPQPTTTDMKPKEGARLKPATEQKLKWGEPAGGLRMALAWPPSLDEPEMGKAQEFYLVVQNVSQAAIRLTANATAPNPRSLIMRSNGSPLSAVSDGRPMPGDWLLAPREVALFRLFRFDGKTKDGGKENGVIQISAEIEKSVRFFPQYSVTAEMSIEKAPKGAWSGKLTTGESRDSVDVIPPKNKDAQALYQSWSTAARADIKISGALIGKLGESVKTFIKNNPTWETTPQLEKMLPRFDASHDWSGQDAVALLDELAAVQDTPIGMALDHEQQGIIGTGAPLPPQLADAPWGKELANGLRLAYLLEPRAAEHRLNTPLNGRILIHNAGKEPVVFRAWSWHQAGHKATDPKGADINISSLEWTTLGRLEPFRLAPGEFIELNTAGIGVGPNRDADDWQNTRVGSWVEAKEGDEVTLTTEPIPLSDWNEKTDGEPRWWLYHITARLSRHQPFPADAEARKLIVYRVAMELFGTPASEEITNAFVADTTPAALDSLARLLFHRPGQQAWAGPLVTGPTKFRVLAADPDAAKRPRTASNPGHYTISENASLQVTRRPVGERIANEAYLSLSAPRKRHDITLPDSYGTWAAAWVRGTSVMWVTQKGLLRRIDFTNPENLEVARYEADNAATAPIPSAIREALRAALAVPEAPKQVQEPLKPATPPPAFEAPKE